MSPILHLHYSSKPNCAELNRDGPAVHNHAGLVSSSSLQLSFMQVGLDVTCMYTNFGACGFFGFGDITTFKNIKISLSDHGL